ncbi:MAG: hypothetical protein V1802_01345 [Candidatus Aenigmatarchaeota archaeon]
MLRMGLYFGGSDVFSGIHVSGRKKVKLTLENWLEYVADFESKTVFLTPKDRMFPDNAIQTEPFFKDQEELSLHIDSVNAFLELRKVFDKYFSEETLERISKYTVLPTYFAKKYLEYRRQCDAVR